MSNEKQVDEFQIPKRSFTVEFWVGVFALIGVGRLGYLATGIAGMSILKTGFYDITAEFDNISGLEKGAPVEIAGVPIGEVNSIELKDTIAYVQMSIRNGVVLRSDDIASIRTKGIIGDRYVRISPGASDKAIVNGASIRDTESAVDIEEIIGKIIHRME